MSNAELIASVACHCGDLSQYRVIVNGHGGNCPRQDLMVAALATALEASDREREVLARALRHLLPINTEGECVYCVRGNKPDSDFYHPDRDNCWNGDQPCLNNKRYDDAREALALVEESK